MAKPMRLLACACLAALVSGCATFGTNVEGDFTCRAPKGDCAPSHVIDARATAVVEDGAAPHDIARVRAGVAGGDTTRTAERTLKIVFPAHVDEAGTLHDEAVAWTVIENPRWAAELRRKAGEETAPPLMRQLRRQLKTAQQKAGAASEEPAPNADAAQGDAAPLEAPDPLPQASPFSLAAPPSPDSAVASPLALPSTAREAVAGAKAPAVEGFDMPSPPHDRTPRPLGQAASPKFPSIEAIQAAIAKRSAGKTTEPATPIKDHK
ncbi:conjugal transfer pilus assembly protein TraV [Novosphingobium kunmingense]|uniref:Conjugal transfer pilus assembly protein TraV n=1 Tax=Novosphingobium kunmingense TaxID=1211806 RepID=A0A2N0I2B9_9SPHN|nr:conjugal transfer protein TraV [Novosphingobium kunmingense]PKB25332.1 conjugal transfer pilus assembly protein TraV [Novosphingobium kunmingense]